MPSSRILRPLATKETGDDDPQRHCPASRADGRRRKTMELLRRQLGVGPGKDGATSPGEAGHATSDGMQEQSVQRALS